MVRKRLDERVRTLMERSVATGQRSLLVLVGDHGKDQIPNLHALMSKMSVRQRPSVLWCYKKDLGFSTHRTKRLKKLKRDKARGLNKSGGTATPTNSSTATSADHFELFISSTDINWCYYKDSHRVLGTTVGMLVLQDFEALTPNLMARTMETVEGGGMIVVLLKTVSSLQQLYHMTMDVHARYRTDNASMAGDLVPRFNERFLLSLATCPNCLVCDDELNILPLSKKALRQLSSDTSQNYRSGGANGEILTTLEDPDLKDLKESLRDTPHVGKVVELAKTMDQAKAVLVFLDACASRESKMTVAMTAGRGRGKSAAMGLCLAGALSLGYSTVAVTAPAPENLVAVFDFVVRGLEALAYKQHLDFTITYNTASGRDMTKCIVAIELHSNANHNNSHSHRQSIRYIPPTKPDQFVTCELLAIDEAAAIPLPVVQALMGGDRLTFLSSTINGYEGTGRALSLKLIKELRDSKGTTTTGAAHDAADAIVGPRAKKGEVKVHEQRWAASAAAAATPGNSSLREIDLSTPIRYAQGDPVEAWLNKLLCLDCGSNESMKLNGGAPAPSECELYHVDRDALFSYHKLSEAFLQKLMGLYTSAHYKNTPNDLQMLSDAPAHSVFCLLSPSAEQDGDSLPDILAVVQVALEGRISRKAVEAQLARGHRSAGDLIPWTISQQFGDSNFAQLSGARIVRIAVHPSVQGMGYGSRAIELLYRFYNGEMFSLSSSPDNEDEDASKKESSDEEDDETNESDSDDESDNGKKSGKKKGIMNEKLAPKKELPPLLLPLTEVKAPRLDWLGTSFGLTAQLFQFWKRAGMRMLYLRQTKNELTGEHSSILVKALPKRTGFDDAWLPAFVSDSQRRITSLLAGPFRDTDVKLAVAILEDFGSINTASENKEANLEIAKRAGSSVEKMTATELQCFLTPHDMKRLELYGRNLCDHHLVTDLLPSVARLYFTGRFGADFSLSSLQGALLCGVGLQNKTIDTLTGEFGLPANQVLAMFNKGVRKISKALQSVVEEAESKRSLLGEDARLEAEQKALKMKNVSHQTLEEDAREGATVAMAKLTGETRSAANKLPADILKDADIMKYAVKGTEDDWSRALGSKEMSATNTVQIANKNAKPKRKLNAEDIEKEIEASMPKKEKTKSNKSKKTRR